MRVNRGRERERRRHTYYRCPSLPVCFFELHHDDLQSMPSGVVWVKSGGLNAVERGGSLAGEGELRTAGRKSEGLCSGSSGRLAVRARAYARGAQDGGPRGRGLMLGHTRTLRHDCTRLQAAYRGHTKPTQAWP